MVATAQHVTELLERLTRADVDEGLDLMRKNLVLLTPLVDAPLASLAAEAERRHDQGLQRRIDATKELLEWGRTAGPTAFLARLNGQEPGPPTAVPSSEYFHLFLATGEPAFLDAAVELLEQLMDVSPASGEPHAAVMHNFSITLGARAAARGDADDAQRAVVAAEGAVAATREGSPAAAARLGNHANSLLTRFGLNHDPDDLDRAVDAAAKSVALGGREATDRFNCRAVHARALATRYEFTRSHEDLQAAISAVREALDATDAGTAERNRAQVLMAHVLKLEARDT
jgi:hypothetical protein